MKIGEVARVAGVATSTIRYYESLGVLPKPARAGGQRRYDEGAVAAIRLVRAMQAANFTLEEIKGLSRIVGPKPSSDRWHAIAHEKLRELDVSIRRLRAARAALRSSLACACGGDVDRCLLVGATRELLP